MSVNSRNINIPDTLRTLELNTNAFKIVNSLFITPKTFVWTTEQWVDADFWYDNLGINIFPLHGVSDFKEEGTKNTITESGQGFSYKAYIGQYKHRFNFDWSLDYHNLLGELSGQEINIVYCSGRVLRGTLNSDGDIKGFNVSLFDLEPIMFDTGSGNGNSEAFIELLNSRELNESGYEAEVDWEPRKLDRLALNISLSFGEDSITMLIKHLSKTIIGIQASDITITDDINGDITFSTYIPGDGVYKLSGFSNTITTACMYIQSTIYIGAKRFTYNYRVVIIRNITLSDGNNMVLSNGENMVLAKN